MHLTKAGAAGILGLCAVVALAIASTATVSAQVVSPELDFSVAIPGVCDTEAGDDSCTLDSGENFTLEVSLNSLPANDPDYDGFDIFVEYTGVTSQDNATNEQWPDCGFPATSYEPGLVAWACALGIDAPPSTYLGVIGSNGFTCTDSGTISLVHTDGNTDLVTVRNIYVEDQERETLTIDCGEAPTDGTPTDDDDATPGVTVVPTTLPGTGIGQPASAQDDTALWIAIAVLAAAAAAGIGTFALRYARR